MITLFDSDIDFSFAICPRRRNNSQRCIERTSFYQDDGYDHSEEDASVEEEEDTSSVDSSSSRSVTFAENIVSEVISVPRYERERVSELFYNRLDIMRFKQERRLERMQVQVIW